MACIFGIARLSGGNISYIYDATGTKLSKTISSGNITYYAGNYVYEGSSLKFFNHPEGYIEPVDPGNYGSGFKYIYQYTDIWNNVRLSYSDSNLNGAIDSNTEIIRELNYYPFGLFHEGYNNVVNGTEHNFETYQDQEFTKDLGLNVHEWKYRISDPAIGRFWQIDPLAEDYVYNSTYAFSENKLGIGIELEGLEVTSFDLRQTRREKAVLKGEMSQKQFMAENKAEAQGALFGVSLLIPGPEDIAIAGFLGSKFGGAIVRGLTKLFSRGGDEVVDVATATKKVPNPNGKKGGEAHQNTMKEVESDLKAEGFDKIDNEVMVKTPDGEKSKRFIDVQGTNTKTGDVKQVQVGKQNKNGTPISREKRAINDVQDVTKKKVEFRPYNKNN